MEIPFEDRTHDLRPCLLVAAPSLRCPYFHHTVVLLVDHRADGSLGFVVNRPADIRMREVLSQVGLEVDTPNPPDAPVLTGGPVAPETGWIVFDPSAGGEVERDGVLRVSDRVGVSANMEVLEEIARGEGPRQHVMMLGYAGWGPGQLDEEIRDGSWIAVDLDASLVFDVPAEERWNAALGKLGIDPARVVSQTVADA